MEINWAALVSGITTAFLGAVLAYMAATKTVIGTAEGYIYGEMRTITIRESSTFISGIIVAAILGLIGFGLVIETITMAPLLSPAAVFGWTTTQAGVSGLLFVGLSIYYWLMVYLQVENKVEDNSWAMAAFVTAFVSVIMAAGALCWSLSAIGDTHRNWMISLNALEIVSFGLLTGALIAPTIQKRTLASYHTAALSYCAIMLLASVFTFFMDVAWRVGA